jgi:hypothetical protein
MKTKATTNSPYNSRRTVEVTLWIFGIVLVLALLISLNASAYTPPNVDDTYIDDIPFDTEIVANNMLLGAYDFEDEAYIDDLPFDTKAVTDDMANSMNDEDEFTFGKETYIDDIPFLTESVVNNYEYNIAINKVFEMPEEIEVDDIPFDTGHIASALKDGNCSVVLACTK